MHRTNNDVKVKKTLVRNFEQKARPSTRKQTAVLDMGCSSNLSTTSRPSSHKENELNQPTICSSEVLANYLTDLKKSVPTPEPLGEVEKYQLGAEMTKKLNFHFNDRIYKNLIELNASIDKLKIKKDKRDFNVATKKDLEPNIEDFCQDERESDIIPTIPIIKPKFKPIKKVESGRHHKLLASFEEL